LIFPKVGPPPPRSPGLPLAVSSAPPSLSPLLDLALGYPMGLSDCSGWLHSELDPGVG
jgi:hypothetical protein